MVRDVMIIMLLWVASCLAILCFRSCKKWLWARRIAGELTKQGIGGPRPSIAAGNLPEVKRIMSSAKKKGGVESSLVTGDYAHALFPYFVQWRKEYGPLFVFWLGGTQAVLHVSQGDMVKEISQCTSLDLGKPVLLQEAQLPLFGRGILKSNGLEWANQRKLIAPEFFMDKVKGMVELMVQSVIPLVDSWEEEIENGGGVGDIIVDEHLRNFTADVISRACFGSNYVEGKEIFLKLRALSMAILKSDHFFRLSDQRFLPTKRNRLIRKLEKEIHTLVLQVVNKRKGDGDASTKQDLLVSILERASDDKFSSGEANRFIVDNCKNIYYAGHETSSASAAWCLMLLASHPHWQQRVREEVMDVCGGALPSADMIKRMKTLTMVIQETLRLYPPSSFVVREAFREMKFAGVGIPKGIDIWIPVFTVHRDKEIWGEDADEFNPERFAGGVANACKQGHGYMPFGIGARTCLGMNMAMVELKVLISVLLQRFSFVLSPEYRHAPAFRLIVQPEIGVRLIVEKV